MTRTAVERARGALLATAARHGDLTSPDVLEASRRVDRLLTQWWRQRQQAVAPAAPASPAPTPPAE